MNWKLIRNNKTFYYTFGTLSNDEFTCFTLERPDKNNAPDISCIPVGVYTCKRVNSPKFGDTFQVMDVPNRDHILIHSGNTVEDVHGCIELGMKQGVLNGEFAVLNSKVAFQKFMEQNIGYDEFTLVVKEA